MSCVGYDESSRVGEREYFLGEVNEPIRSTSNPYGKMEMGIPFTKRPVRLIFDYKYKASPDDFRTESTGFSSRKQLAGRDSAEVYICCSTGGKMRTEMCMLVVWALGENDI